MTAAAGEMVWASPPEGGDVEKRAAFLRLFYGNELERGSGSRRSRMAGCLSQGEPDDLMPPCDSLFLETDWKPQHWRPRSEGPHPYEK